MKRGTPRPGRLGDKRNIQGQINRPCGFDCFHYTTIGWYTSIIFNETSRQHELVLSCLLALYTSSARTRQNNNGANQWSVSNAMCIRSSQVVRHDLNGDFANHVHHPALRSVAQCAFGLVVLNSVCHFASHVHHHPAVCSVAQCVKSAGLQPPG